MNLNFPCENNLSSHIYQYYPTAHALIPDHYFLRMCYICNVLYFAVGDGGYPQQPWLMTPINPTTVAQQNYNHAHIQTRGVIERTFGVLKSRMRCLDRTGGALAYTPEKVCKIVVACCIVHNIAIRHGIPLEDMEPPEDIAPAEDIAFPPQQYDMAEGRRLRQEIIGRYFS